MKLLTATWRWVDERTGLGKVVSVLVGHPVPRGARWAYVFGSAALFAFLLQVATGLALATVYVPATGEAYDSLQFITHEAPLGSLLRGLHYFGASAMVVLVGIHLIRVFLTASYKYPREVQWLSGVLLLVLTLGMAFTGQLLRWDQNAYWSLVVGAEQAGRTPFIGHWLAEFIIGGQTVGGNTLTRFFVLHVLLIPGLIVAFVGFHLYLVIRNGISEPPRVGEPVDPDTYRQGYEKRLKRDGVPFWPNAAWRDLTAGALVVLVVLVLAAVFGPAALDKPPDPTQINAHPRPDWYFWWYFALLALLPHGLEDYVILLGPALIGVLLLLVPFAGRKGERHVRRRPWALASVVLIVSVIAALTVAGKNADWSPRFDAVPLTAAEIGASQGPVYEGGMLFNAKGCLYCHSIEGHGGFRGPDLTDVADRLTNRQMTLRVLNGGYNMPAFAGILSSDEMRKLQAFLASRKRHP